MANDQRKIYDYNYEKKFLFRIGHVRHLEARYPMGLHEHGPMTELVYQERGYQNYQVHGENYVVHQGEVFFTRPNEPHSTGSFPREISMFYYIIIDLELLSKMNIFASHEEYVQLTDFFIKNNTRIFKASDALPAALKHLFNCFEVQDPYFDTRIRNALSEVLIALLMPFTSGKQSSAFHMERSLKYIDEHLEENLHITELAALANTSLSTYNKYFIQTTGMPPGEYILNRKIEKTRELLTSTDLSVTEIACKYGFSSSQYFATVFKRFCNMTPSQYRRLPARNSSHYDGSHKLSSRQSNQRSL